MSLCYYGAVTVGDTIAQSLFVSRLGVGALPDIFLLKAGINVISGFLYLPLTHGRSPRTVWRVLLSFYVGVVGLGAWACFGAITDASAYLLYAGHEVAWTLAVIHWGILLLDVISPGERNKRFPMLFGIGRLGALLGGLVVGALAVPLGAVNLLGVALVLALASMVASTQLGDRPPTLRPETPHTQARRDAMASPLVRLIALTTIIMVMLRYGMRIVSLDEIRTAFDHDKDQVARFLGLFSVVGNAMAFVLGIYVVPKFLARFRVEAANLAYAASTVVAFLVTWLAPSLASASIARFVEMPLKHALKTPLSVLFYGAETAPVRIAARSLIFGVAIPIASVATAFGVRGLGTHIEIISALGIALAVLFLGLCTLQNRSYRRRLRLHPLAAEIGRATLPYNANPP